MNINALAAERNLNTGEMYPANDIYGLAKELKRFAGIADNYSLRCIIEPGVGLKDDYYFQEHATPPYSCVLQVSNQRKAVYGGERLAFAIGPYIHYAQHAYTQEELAAEKQRLGHNLLVFPDYVSYVPNVIFDEDTFIRAVEKCSVSFDSVVICLQWRDVLKGRAKAYEDKGYQVVTAGHIYDAASLGRLKSFIECSSAIFSNSYDEYIGYAIFMNKPVSLFNMYLSCTQRSADYFFSTEVGKEFQRVFSLFSAHPDCITEDQYCYASQKWGFSSIREKEELLSILVIAEGGADKRGEIFTGSANYAHNLTLSYLLTKQLELARLCANEICDIDNLGRQISLLVNGTGESHAMLSNDIFMSDLLESL
jgi:hypothetical protein